MYQRTAPNQSVLPTMYDLPSEAIGESGLPDEFHRFQAQLLIETCRSPLYGGDRLFMASDLNLYYDSRNRQRYKRPDWFLCLDVPTATQQADLRWSYLVWQESVPPFLVIELLSPGTEEEDLGETVRRIDKPPRKWDVYETFLRIPYYGLYDRYTNHFRLFRIEGTRYQEVQLSTPQFWFEELNLGLGVWHGAYQGITGLWLRWYDAAGQWVLMEAEQERLEKQQAQQQAEQERLEKQQAQQQAEQAQQRAERLAELLRSQGIDPDQL